MVPLVTPVTLISVDSDFSGTKWKFLILFLWVPWLLSNKICNYDFISLLFFKFFPCSSHSPCLWWEAWKTDVIFQWKTTLGWYIWIMSLHSIHQVFNVRWMNDLWPLGILISCLKLFAWSSQNQTFCTLKVFDSHKNSSFWQFFFLFRFSSF